MSGPFPTMRQVVLDCTAPRLLAEFYRELLDLHYRPGDQTPRPGEDWLVLRHDDGSSALAFQQADDHVASTWPDPAVPQQLHLDLTVPTIEDLETRHSRAIALGATLLLDRFDDPEEPLRVYADPAGHPFCIFVAG